MTSFQKLATTIRDAPGVLNKAGEKAFGTREPGDLSERIGQIIGIFLTLIGAVFFLLIIYGGYKWMMARGAPEEAKKAKEIITDAVIGLIIVLAAYVISNFVVAQITEKISGA